MCTCYACTAQCVHGGAACINSGEFPHFPAFCSNTEPWLKLRTTTTRIPSSNTTILGDKASENGYIDNDGSGSLSPASAALVEEVARGINALRKGKVKAVKASRSASLQPSVLPFANLYQALRQNVPISPPTLASPHRPGQRDLPGSRCPDPQLPRPVTTKGRPSRGGKGPGGLRRA